MTRESNWTAPQLVYQSASTIAWKGSDWTTLVLDRPVPLDGQSGLVIEVQKELAPASASGFLATMSTGTMFSLPNGLPDAIWATGPLGSGASMAPRADAVGRPIQMRLLVDTPTITLRSDPVTGRTFEPGSAVEVAAYGQPGSCYCAIIDVAFQTPYVLAGVLGFGRVHALAEFPLRDVPASGRDVFSFQLPNNPDLAGSWFMLQAGFALPGAPAAWSNATAFRVSTM